MKVYYGKAVYGKEEINASLKVLNKKSLSLIDGPSVKKLEYKVARIFGKKYGLMVNSGSSANLLAFASLKLKKGSEVITPTLTFSTTDLNGRTINSTDLNAMGSNPILVFDSTGKLISFRNGSHLSNVTSGVLSLKYDNGGTWVNPTPNETYIIKHPVFASYQ